MTEKDDKFYDRADAHIHLANDQVTEDLSMGNVSASFMFGMSRYAAFISATKCENEGEMITNKEEHIDYFVNEFKKAFINNYDDYIDNFSKYMDR